MTDHINTIDKLEFIKVMYEEVTDGKLPFRDTFIAKKEDDAGKLLVYRKPTHTDQNLIYKSHHPAIKNLVLLEFCMTEKTI